MALVNLKTALEDAYKNKYAVGAFNIAGFEFLQSIRDAAEKNNSPVIFNIAQVHFPYVDLDDFIPSVISILEKAKIPCVLNLDHGLDFEAVAKCVRKGFTSVMIDGSKLDYEDNINQTKEIVKLCHSLDISVEAELGAVGGDEGGGIEATADEKFYTDPNQAKDFVKRTGIDALAVAIGNAHGKYKGTPKLDFERLDAINKEAGVPLVLHGGSGIPDNDFRKAITMGISKINFYTGMSQAALDTMTSAVNNVSGKYNDYILIKEKIKASISKIVEEQMDIFGSINKY
jgi:fructose-bisphosphate aldolase, class II